MKSILCIDIGGSRIKAAVLSEKGDLVTLKRSPLVTMRTMGWLNQSLPEIISKGNWASIANQNQLPDDYTEISICVPGPLKNGRFFRPDLDVPRDLLNLFQEFSDKQIHLFKDADAWTAGAIAYLKLSAESFSFPLVALAFGTGVGLSAARDYRHLLSMEISQWPWPFPSLSNAAGRAVRETWNVHQMLGNNFFDWVAREKRHWDYNRIRSEFSKRVEGLITDLVPQISRRIGPVRSVIVGGGNSEFVSIRSLREGTGLEIKSLWSRQISVNPDLIPLLGLYHLATSGNLIIETF